MQIQNNGRDWGVSHKFEVRSVTGSRQAEKHELSRSSEIKPGHAKEPSSWQRQTFPQTISFQDEPLSCLYLPFTNRDCGKWLGVLSLTDFHQLGALQGCSICVKGGSGSSRLDLDPWSTYFFHLHRLAVIRPYLFTALQSTSGRHGEVKRIWREATICFRSHLRREGQSPSTCPVLRPVTEPWSQVHNVSQHSHGTEIVQMLDVKHRSRKPWKLTVSGIFWLMMWKVVILCTTLNAFTSQQTPKTLERK